MKVFNVAAVVLGLMLCMFAVGQSQQPSKPTGQIGRYQISLYQGEMPRMNTYLLDTTTGKVWMMVSAPDKTNFWEPMYKVDNEGEEMGFIRSHREKPAEPANQ